ncbi:MAG: replication initiator protein A [Fusobacteriaceae bacterium]
MSTKLKKEDVENFNESDIIILEDQDDSDSEAVETDVDSFNILTSGALSNDIKKMEIKLTEVPDIEVREVIIKRTGNFLNLKDNIINIPIEMLIFPFFTPQKQNKRINFQYTFEDMGVSMHCTLIAKNAADKVFQPSIFEEKIYTYLISMYEGKKDADDDNEYIDFEINDFIVNFIGNKMNRTYYTKVEQALKNLKNTEYQFVVSNHTKLGAYKFEDEEFKLLTYQKLKVGKKIYYRITLNKNIRKKIKDKRYIKYNSKTLVEMMNIDPIAARIYKYISQMRYDKNSNTINIRTLAAIIPLKTEQVTERVSKNGDVKNYVLCRLKQVLGRIEKAYDILADLKYIKSYQSNYNEKENTYYITYEFNIEKDGACHISEHTLKNNLKNNVNLLESKDSKKDLKTATVEKKQKIEEALVIEKTNSKPKESKKVPQFEFPESVLEKIKKAKRNRYFNKAWDKRAENKIQKIFLSYGEAFTVKLLNEVYKGLNSNINTSLVQYLNGVINNMRLEHKVPTKTGKEENLTLFGNFGCSSETSNLNKLTKTGIKRAAKTFVNTVITVPKTPKEEEVRTLKEFINDDIHEKKAGVFGAKYDALDEFEKLKVEERAIKLCCAETNMPEKTLLTVKQKLKPAYENTIKKYIERLLNEDFFN